MKKERLRIRTEQGYFLAAELDLPDTARPVAFAVFAHCFTCTRNLKSIGKICESLTDAGLAVLRFDFTGVGDSGGDFSETNFSSNVDDLITVARFLDKEYQAPTLLIGHSLGGTAVVEAAQYIKSCAAVATIASPFEPGDVARRFLHKKADVERDGEAEINVGGTGFKITNKFFEVLETGDMRQTLEYLGKALLILHSPVDETVVIDNASSLYAAASHPKSFVSLYKADHLLSNNKDAYYAGSIIATWVKRYI